MNYWSLGLHFYQPPTQELEITRNILNFCYLPLLRMLAEKSGFELTVNMSGSLLVQLHQAGAVEFFDLTKRLLHEGKIEIVNSAMYHPLIPITAKDVVARQIEQNRQILKELLGVETTTGFFPPELAVDQESLDLLRSRYVFVDQTAVDTRDPIAKYGKKYLLVNNRPICELLRGYPTQLHAQTVLDVVNENCQENGLVVSVNDAELFGHHYAERLQTLVDVLDSRQIELMSASKALEKFGERATEATSIKASTWQDCEGFSLWNKNPLQKEYLKLIDLAHGNVNDNKFFDQANSSCYLYWLSNWPWWHPGLVESGVESLKKGVAPDTAHQNFLHHMWEYHKSGQVEKNYERFRNRADSKKEPREKD